MLKKIISFLLASSIMMSMCPYVFASDVPNTNGQAESTSSSVSSVDESEKKSVSNKTKFSTRKNQSKT